MSDTSQGDGWWAASDGKWYAPELHPDYVAPVGAVPPMAPPPTSPPTTPPVVTPPSFGTTGVDVEAAGSGESSTNRMPFIFGGLGVAVLLAALAFFVLGGDDGDDDPSSSAAIATDDGDDPATDPDLGSDIASDDFSDPDLGSDDFSDPDLGSDDFSDPDLGSDDFSDTGTDPDLGSDPGSKGDTPTTDPVAPGSTECSFIEIDFADDIQVELRFTSPTTQVNDIDVGVTLFDANGAVFAERSEYVQAATPGERFRIEHDTLTEFPAGTNPSNFRCEITQLEPSNFAINFTPPGAGDQCRIVELDSFGDIQIELTVTNPFGETADVGVQFVLRRGDERFDGSNAFWDAMAAGESRSEGYDTLADLPAGSSLDELECQIIGLQNWS